MPDPYDPFDLARFLAAQEPGHARALERFYGGAPDPMTLRLLGTLDPGA